MLNGPQGGLAFYLQCLDGSQFGVPPAPALASEAYATELVELYWASLLRDVAFTDYPTNATVAKAAAELSSSRPLSGAHIPSGFPVFAMTHALQPPLHADAQQTPATQKPD